MIRRNLLALLGLAPAAAVVNHNTVMPGPPPGIPTSIPFDDGNIAVTTLATQAYDDPIKEAKRRINALRWAEKHGLDVSNDYFGDGLELSANAMRSWSEVTKFRVIVERRRKFMRENMMQSAVDNLERRIKLAAAPEWMRRYL